MQNNTSPNENNNYNTEKYLNEYLKQFSDIQLKTIEIAKEHLGTSFSIHKSNGYIEWLKKNNYK